MPTGPDTRQSRAARGSDHLSVTERQAATDAAPRPILSVGVLGAGNELAALHGKRYWTASPRLVEIAATGGTFGTFGKDARAL